MDRGKMRYNTNKMRLSPINGDESVNVQLPALLSRPRGRNLSKAIVINLDQTQYSVVEEVSQELAWHLSALNWDVKWVDSAITVDTLAKMQPHQKINHFPGMSILARKNNLEKSLAKIRQFFDDDYDFTPRTFLLPQDVSKLRVYLQKHEGRTLIVKPEAGCQGRGIYLAQSLSDIEIHSNCIVQEYLDSPLLCEGLKFDFRVYALVAGCDPLRIYIYNEGLVRLATQPYSPPDSSNIDNLFIHLTNYAINKNNPSYLFNQSLSDLSYGHKRSLAQFFQSLKKHGCPAQQYWADIKTVIVKTLIAGQPHLQHEYRAAHPYNFPNDMCFQILGFDFMIDSCDKCYLLEVNHSPSFSTDTPLDYLVKANLIKDAFLLLNITPSSKAISIARTTQETSRRVFTGKSLRTTPEERRAIVAHFQAERDAFERTHLGSFERIYPSKNPARQTLYDQLIKVAQGQYGTNIYKEQPPLYRIKHSHPSPINIQKEQPLYRIKDTYRINENLQRYRAMSSSQQENPYYAETPHKTNQHKKRGIYRSTVENRVKYYDEEKTRNSLKKE